MFTSTAFTLIPQDGNFEKELFSKQQVFAQVPASMFPVNGLEGKRNLRLSSKNKLCRKILEQILKNFSSLKNHQRTRC